MMYETCEKQMLLTPFLLLLSAALSAAAAASVAAAAVVAAAGSSRARTGCAMRLGLTAENHLLQGVEPPRGCAACCCLGVYVHRNWQKKKMACRSYREMQQHWHSLAAANSDRSSSSSRRFN